MNHYRYHSIEQYRNVIRTVRDRCKYHELPLPKVTFCGTVKLHGTNAGVVLDARTGDVYAQSRELIIVPGQDNAGFAAYLEENRESFTRFLKHFAASHGEGYTHFAVYGEWCGQGIMKGVAVNQLPKMFVIFGAKVIREVPDGDAEQRWLSVTELNVLVAQATSLPESVKYIGDFKSYMYEIDFAAPELAQNHLVELTNIVERECPVGKALGVEGVGEGIVWSSNVGINEPLWRDLIFKVKGEKHSDTKVKTLVEVDVEAVQRASDFVSAVVTEHRLEKAEAKLVELGVELDVKNTGQFLKLIGGDVLKEESDRLAASNLEWKSVAGQVATAARQWWLKRVSGA